MPIYQSLANVANRKQVDMWLQKCGLLSGVKLSLHDLIEIKIVELNQ